MKSRTVRYTVPCYHTPIHIIDKRKYYCGTVSVFVKSRNMFSWSTSTGKYPGARNRVSSANNNVPSSQFSSSMTSGGIPRSEHLKSLLEDPMLKPSTRRVSQGSTSNTFSCCIRCSLTLENFLSKFCNFCGILMFLFGVGG